MQRESVRVHARWSIAVEAGPWNSSLSEWRKQLPSPSPSWGMAVYLKNGYAARSESGGHAFITGEHAKDARQVRR